ncbi:hypothetical protein SAMN04488066_10480 [Halorubrum aquaticum]|uniref:Uncharacterized protein n=1 Tax=Halorubrum aquaticum TaxID=387340 RepID=A0A1I3A2B4_9EURY|nr:hypothetical protein [Halorubrum aquaticum]SFH44302.1 hypothetical protein SAMN04488066_10480 [Halorubrum aquaticum]
MGPEIRTESSVYEKTARERVAAWVLIEGDRRIVAGGITVGIAGIVGVLIWGDVLAVGPDSSVDSLFSSGLTAGVMTIITITLSINQLVMSRVTGTIDALMERLDGARELHEDVADLAGRPSSPNDPAAFLSLIARTLSERASTLRSMNDSGGRDPPSEVTNALRDIGEYGENIDSQVEDDTRVGHVLSILLGTEYAVNLRAVQRLRNGYSESLPEEVQAEFRAIERLLESIAIVRQFYKTIALQQDFAELSRMIVYTGLIAFVTTIVLTLVYRTNSVTIPPSTLPVVVSLGIGVVTVPLTLFVSYILRVATVARRTVSVGPFIPP